MGILEKLSNKAVRSLINMGQKNENKGKRTKRAKEQKPVQKWVKNAALVFLLMGTGAGANELLSNNKEVQALDKQNALVEEVETSTEDVAIVTEDATADVEEKEEVISEETTSTVIEPMSAVRSVQAVTNPIASKPLASQNLTSSVKTTATPVVAKKTDDAKPTATTTSTSKVADKTETKPSVTPAKSTTTDSTTVKVEEKPVKSVVETPTTKLTFVKLDGSKEEVEFQGKAEDFSGMYIFKDGKWVALSKEESLKVNPYQNLNWTRNNLIVQAIEWERQGASKEQAWNAYYEFEAKQKPEHYEVVNGYTRPNKAYFAELVSSSISAAKEGFAKGGTFTTNEWLRNAQEHLNSYNAAPGKEVLISGLENGKVPTLTTGKSTSKEKETISESKEDNLAIVEMIRPDGIKVFVHPDFVNENLKLGYILVEKTNETPAVKPEATQPTVTVASTDSSKVETAKPVENVTTNESAPVTKPIENTTANETPKVDSKPVETVKPADKVTEVPVKKPVVNNEDASKGKTEDLKPETTVTDKSEQTVSNDKASESTPVVEKEEPVAQILVTQKVIKISEDSVKGGSEDLKF